MSENSEKVAVTAELYLLDSNDKIHPVMLLTSSLHWPLVSNGWLVMPEKTHTYSTSRIRLRLDLIKNYSDSMLVYLTCATSVSTYQDDHLIIDDSGYLYLLGDLFSGPEGEDNEWRIHRTHEVYNGFGKPEAVFTLQQAQRAGFVQLAKSGELTYLRQMDEGTPARFVFGDAKRI